MTEGPLLVADTTYASLAEIEHLLLDLGQRVSLPSDAYVCTHMVRDQRPHYAFSVALTDADVKSAESTAGQVHDMLLALGEARGGFVRPGQDVATVPAGLRSAYDEASSRAAGRCVRFPGAEHLVGTVSVAHLLARSAIDRVEVLGGRPAEPDDDVHTRDFVRPWWRDGELVLPVLPAGAGAVAPFEVPNPTPCCGEHTRSRLPSG